MIRFHTSGQLINQQFPRLYSDLHTRKIQFFHDVQTFLFLKDHGRLLLGYICSKDGFPCTYGDKVESSPSKASCMFNEQEEVNAKASLPPLKENTQRSCFTRSTGKMEQGNKKAGDI